MTGEAPGGSNVKRKHWDFTLVLGRKPICFRGFAATESTIVRRNRVSPMVVLAQLLYPRDYRAIFLYPPLRIYEFMESPRK